MGKRCIEKGSDMICAIMQPTYIPWIGYFDLIDSADKFVFLDNVKLEKSSWQVRNRIQTQQGELFLTIPVLTPKGRMETVINETFVDTRVPWGKKHLRSIEMSYCKAPYFNEVFPLLKELYSYDAQDLASINIHIIRSLCQKLGIKTEFYRSSELEGVEGVKDERLVSICSLLACDQYLSPVGSAEYLENETPGGNLTKHNIKLFYQNYEHPEYVQMQEGFVSYMSVVDLLFSCGFQESIGIIRSGHRDMIPYQEFRQKVLNI